VQVSRRRHRHADAGVGGKAGEGNTVSVSELAAFAEDWPAQLRGRRVHLQACGRRQLSASLSWRSLRRIGRTDGIFETVSGSQLLPAGRQAKMSGLVTIFGMPMSERGASSSTFIYLALRYIGAEKEGKSIAARRPARSVSHPGLATENRAASHD